MPLPLCNQRGLILQPPCDKFGRLDTKSSACGPKYTQMHEKEDQLYAALLLEPIFAAR